ncbi:hypothetical protein [Streptomyces sp. NBC_01314]|nr:hypothetical protein OG622_02230 [Streptomyces sp. NBC_01314]
MTTPDDAVQVSAVRTAADHLVRSEPVRALRNKDAHASAGSGSCPVS